MRLPMEERRPVSEVVAMRYQKTTKKEKVTIVCEYTQLTGYNCFYATSFLLTNHDRRMRINNNTVLVGKVGHFAPKLYSFSFHIIAHSPSLSPAHGLCALLSLRFG